jgi:hypothetical protein
MPDDVEISDNNTFECVIPVSKEETKSISFGSDITDLDITKPEKQKVTISD